jgi:hypothetical protein
VQTRPRSTSPLTAVLFAWLVARFRMPPAPTLFCTHKGAVGQAALHFPSFLLMGGSTSICMLRMVLGGGPTLVAGWQARGASPELAAFLRKVLR